MQHPQLDELVRRDPRYAPEAYEFVYAALAHTLQRLGRTPPDGAAPWEGDHVTVPELLDGVRDLAVREFGLMARTVFHAWGVDATDDFGEIVFNLVEARLMDPTAADDRRLFHNVYDLDEALVRDFHIEIAEEAEEPL